MTDTDSRTAAQLGAIAQNANIPQGDAVPPECRESFAAFLTAKEDWYMARDERWTLARPDQDSDAATADRDDLYRSVLAGKPLGPAERDRHVKALAVSRQQAAADEENAVMILGDRYRKAVASAREHIDEGNAHTLQLIADAHARLDQALAALTAAELAWHASLRGLGFWESVDNAERFPLEYDSDPSSGSLYIDGYLLQRMHVAAALAPFKEQTARVAGLLARRADPSGPADEPVDDMGPEAEKHTTTTSLGSVAWVDGPDVPVVDVFGNRLA